MHRPRYFLVFGLMLLIYGGISARAEILTSFVVDEAGVFTPVEAKELNSALIQLKSVRQINLVILGVHTLGGDSLEDFANRRFHAYKIGEKGIDNGLLFLIVKDEHKMRLEVGYGLEAGLPDVEAKRLLDLEIRPYFQKSEYAEGCFHLIARLSGDQMEIQRPSKGSSVPMAVRFLPIGLTLFFSLFIYFLGYKEDLFPETKDLNRIFGVAQWPEKARRRQQRARFFIIIKRVLLWVYIALSVAGCATAFISPIDWLVASITVASFLLGFLSIFLFRVLPFSCPWKTWYKQYPEPIKSKIRNLLKSQGYRYSPQTDTFLTSSTSSSSGSSGSSSSSDSSPSTGGDSGGGGANSSW